MKPTVKKLLSLALKLAPIPSFLLALGTWGFVFSRYSDPPVDMAGRVLAATIASASAAAAAKKAPMADKRRAFTPSHACLQQQSLYPSQFASLNCSSEELGETFGWDWAPAVKLTVIKGVQSRVKASASGEAPAPPRPGVEEAPPVMVEGQP